MWDLIYSNVLALGELLSSPLHCSINRLFTFNRTKCFTLSFPDTQFLTGASGTDFLLSLYMTKSFTKSGLANVFLQRARE